MGDLASRFYLFGIEEGLRRVGRNGMDPGAGMWMK